jgi:medium-chain acyl-[acyl-carrier-protein] hydrolase
VLVNSPAQRPGAWVVTPVRNQTARARLFCFPYAGAGTAAFQGWARQFPADLECCIVQLPGRESRIREQPVSDWGVLTDSLSAAFRDWADRPFAFFGHSLGATVAFDLARRLRREGRPLPIHLFVSARVAPQLPLARPPVHHLPDAEFHEELRELQGTPEEVLRNEELMSFLLPLLRADFTLAENYPYREEPPLELPISAYGGVEDSFAPEAAIDAWGEHTSAGFRRTMYPGGHFFLHECQAELLAAISQDIRATLAAT